MTFRAYLWLMGIMTVVAWFGWGFVVSRIDPDEAGIIGLLIFYITLFAALIGTFAVGGAMYRVILRGRSEVVFREVRITFRHAVMVSFVGLVSLALSAKDWLSGWVLLGLVVGVGMVEYLFLLVQESHRN
ncbi:MAG: hypothetical protein WCV84_01135 [Patescibacteria group bacterium]